MITTILLICHFIADFILQSTKSVNLKKKSILRLFGHGLIYAAAILLVLLLTASFPGAILSFTVIVISHLVIDIVKIFLERRASAQNKLLIYFIDQILHISIIIVVSALTGLNDMVNGSSSHLIANFGYNNVILYLAYTLAYLIMMQPAAITIRNILSVCTVSDATGEISLCQEKSNKAGYLIGILERIIIVTFVMQNQLGAIGFVLAAKSLARFKQLEDKEFAEKYLIGTLSSVALALLVALLIKQIFIAP